MEKEKIERINFLARKSRTEQLSAEEKDEQTVLRNEYREDCKKNFLLELENTYVIDEDGKKQKLLKK